VDIMTVRATILHAAFCIVMLTVSVLGYAQTCIDYRVPTMIGRSDVPNVTHDIFLSGSLAYVACDGGLLVFDVSDPYSPELIGSQATPDVAAGVTVVGDYAYVADASGLRTIDVSSPDTPQIVDDVDYRDPLRRFQPSRNRR